MTVSSGTFIATEAQIKGRVAFLMPSGERAQEVMQSLKPGDKVLVKVHKARWPEHHDLAWAVFDRIGKAVGKPKELILTWLKIRTGRIDFVPLPTGKQVPVPQSIKFESMSQQDFQAFWDDAWVVITEEILPGLTKRQYEEIVGLVCPSGVIRKRSA